jgi:hypothetical protein
LRIDKSASITLKIASKQIVRPEGVISNVLITIMRVFTIVDFHMVLKKMGLTQ